MRQVTYVEPGRVEEWDVDAPALRGPREALVRPLAVATCDLDPALVRGLTPYAGPFPLGHEGVAEIVAVGDGIEALKPGDRVIVPLQVSCGECARCRAGLTAHCEGTGGEFPGPQNYGIGDTARTWGGFLSDLVRVPFADHMLVRVPDGIAPETVASLADNVVDGWRTVAEPLARHPGAPVLVAGGAGSIGLYAVAAARALGAGRVTYLDRSRRRLAKAQSLGAEVEQIGDEWPRKLAPVPVTVDASASPDGLRLALRSTDSGGICTSIGIYFEPVPLPLFQMFLRGITFVTGVIQSRPSVPHVLELVASGRLDPAPVTDRVLPWQDAVAALPELAEKLVFSRAA